MPTAKRKARGRSSESFSKHHAGRWAAILRALGVPPKYLRRGQGPCPLCGGKDRFRFDDLDGRGTWFCNLCGAGDGPQLATRYLEIDFKELARLVEDIAGNITPDRNIRTKPMTNRHSSTLWASGHEILADDPVDRYLTKRGFDLPYPEELRTVDDCPYTDLDSGEPIGTCPAMIARVTDAEGAGVRIHRTYLTNDGLKADMPSPRRLMPGSGDMKGASIKLSPCGPVLGVAEGIETALAAAHKWKIPCWSLVNTSIMVSFEPPEGTEKLVIFADNDRKYGGERAAFMLAHRVACQNEGPAVAVLVPEEMGTDFWDEYMTDIAAERWPDHVKVGP